MAALEHILRAYDVRGIFNAELTADVAAKIGASFGTYIGGEGRVLVGRDVRTSSIIVENAFCAGLASTGIDVVSTGLVPIPVANYGIVSGDYDAGAYVTASHNPPEYNGVRLRRRDGSGYTEENQRVWNIFLKDKMKLARWDGLGSIEHMEADEALDDYKDFLLKRISLPGSPKVVLDIGNGAAYSAAPTVLRDAGARVVAMNDEPDGKFPSRPSEPNEKTLTALRRRVVKEHADFGAGYDGDGDRVIFADDMGRVVQTEKIGIILARDILRKKKGVVVANISCSMIVEEEVEKLGGRVHRVRVGDVFVCEAIKKHNAVFAMETSAHLFMPEFYVFDDPILATLLLSGITARSDRKLSEMVDEIPSYPYIEKNFKCSDAIKFKIIDEIKKDFRKLGYEIDTTDGVKVNFEDGWILLRPSNTNPLIRSAVEARSKRRVAELMRMTEEEFKKAMGRAKGGG